MKKLKLNLLLNDDVGSIVGDKLLLSLAFENMLRAIDELAGQDAVPRLNVSRSAECEGHVKITIEDRGPGLTAEEMHNLFELTHLDYQMSPGASLGLFISKKLIQAQHCQFNVFTKPESGTVFEVLLPLLDGSVAEQPSS